MSENEALKHFSERLEKIAFSIPAPNPYTPQLIMLANEMQSAALNPPARPSKDSRPDP